MKRNGHKIKGFKIKKVVGWIPDPLATFIARIMDMPGTIFYLGKWKIVMGKKKKEEE